MKKSFSVVLCLLVLICSAFTFVACDFQGTVNTFDTLCNNSNKPVTYSYDGKTSYIIGEEFEAGKVVASNGKTYDVTKDDVTGFSTETSTGNSKFTVTVNDTALEFPYFVCMQATPITGEADTVTNGVYIYRNLEYGTEKRSPAPMDSMFSTSATARDQIFDAYLPAELGKIAKDTNVVLYIHGGGWIMGDKDFEGPLLCTKLAKNGFAVFTMNYNMQNITGTTGCSMDDMISDIGTMVAYLKNLLPTLGIEADKIAIAGVSAGGHLSSLYAYTMNDYSPLKIGFEIDIVGPNKFSDPAYQTMLENMLHGDNTQTTEMTTGTLVKNLLAAGFPAIINGLLGNDESNAMDLSGDLTEMWDAADVYSPICYIDANTCPTICAYGKVDTTNATGLTKTIAELGFFEPQYDNDLLVPVNTYYEMMDTLEKNNVPHVGKLYENYSHLEVGQNDETQAWIIEQALAFAELYL